MWVEGVKVIKPFFAIFESLWFTSSS
jgi:hypothetical protein